MAALLDIVPRCYDCIELMKVLTPHFSSKMSDLAHCAVIQNHTCDDIIGRAMAKAGFHAYLEAENLARSKCKRPDGMTLVPCWSLPSVWILHAETLCAPATMDTHQKMLEKQQTQQKRKKLKNIRSWHKNVSSPR